VNRPVDHTTDSLVGCRNTQTDADRPKSGNTGTSRTTDTKPRLGWHPSPCMVYSQESYLRHRLYKLRIYIAI
jgi:hypothetical protein